MLIYLQIIYGLFHKASAELNSFSKDHTVYRKTLINRTESSR